MSRSSRRRVCTLIAALLGVQLASGVCLAQSEPQASGDQAAERGYRGANGLLQREMFDLAADEYRQFLTEHPDHAKAPVARYGLAVCLYRQGKHEPAAEELSRLAELRGFEYAAETLAMLGQCQLELGQAAKACQTLERFLRAHKKHTLAADVAAMLVEAYYRDNQHARAAKQAAALVQNWPTSPRRERALLLWGLSLVAQQDWPAAIEKLALLLKEFPQTPAADQAALLLAQCHDQRAALEKAERWYRRVLAHTDSPYVPDALLGLASVLQRRGRNEDAGPLLDRLLSEYADNPMRPRALLARGRVWFDQDDYEKAAGAFEQLAKTGDEFADQAAYWLAKCKLRGGDFKAAARQLTRAIERHPDSVLLAEMRYDRAVALVQGGGGEPAVAALKEFLAEYPQHEMTADALQLLATLEHQAGAYVDSRGHCREFLRQFPEHTLTARLRFLAAENDFLAGKHDNAVAAYRLFLEKHPADALAARATFRLGMALYQLKRYDEAREPLAKTAELVDREPTLRASLLALGDLHFGRGEWKQAETYLTRYLAGDDDVPAAGDALLKLGLARQRQDRPEAACAAFDRLLAKHADSPHRLHALFERGQALVSLERFPEAQAAFELVLKEGEDSRFAAFALNHLGALAARDQQPELAAKHFAAVLEHDPEPKLDAEARLRFGQSSLTAEKYADAERALQRFLKDNSEHAQATTARAQLAIAVARQDRAADALKLIGQIEGASAAQLDDSLRFALGYEKAWCLRKLECDDEAATAYRELLAGIPNDAQRAHPLLELAEIETAAGHHEQAAGLLRELRELSSRDSDVPAEIRSQGTYRLGVCEFERGQFDPAAKVLGEFLEQWPRHELAASAGFFRGEVLVKLDRHRDAAECLTRVAESFQKDPVYGPSLLRLGECLAVLQHWQRSESVLAEHRRKFADDEHWYQAQFGIGWARENQGRHDEAIAAYRQVVARHQGPTAARAQFQIGECLFARKQYEPAVRELLKVDILYAYPQWSAAALYEAGRCFEQMGKLVEAGQQFRVVRDKYGESKWAPLASKRLAAISDGGLPGRSAN